MALSRLAQLAGFLGLKATSSPAAAASSQRSSSLATAATAQQDASAPPAGALNPKEFRAYKLIHKEQLTPNTFLFRFEMPDNQVSGIFIASCLLTRALLKDKAEDAEAKAVVRPYTPTSAPETQGHLDLVIKVYPNGKMSRHIDSLKIGEALEMKGPIPKYAYVPNIKKRIGMVAGGTGITPMLQVIDAVLANPDDTTRLSLIYGNVSENDIILKDKIDALAAKHPEQLEVYYVVDRVIGDGANWKGGVGYLTRLMLEQHLPPPSDDCLVMVCGPPGMMMSLSGQKAPDLSQGEVSGLLGDLGYTKSNVYKF